MFKPLALKNLLSLIFFLFVSSVFAERVPVKYENAVYEDQIKTVQVYQSSGQTEVLPMFALGLKNQLTLSFDLLKESNEFFQYTLIHCSYDWKPSNLDQGQYLEGNRFENVNDFAISRNTFTTYINYKMTFPNENMQPKFSGNYLLKVYRNFDDSDVVITWRFFVIDPKVTIEAEVMAATLPEFRFSSQEVDFKVNTEKVQIIFPENDAFVAVNQNMISPFTYYKLKPRFMMGSTLDYNLEKGNVFGGGNEFRNIDFRTLRYAAMNIDYKKIVDGRYNLKVRVDEPRFQNTYQTFTDFNGQYLILNRDGNDPRVDADYADVEFTYSVPKINFDGEYYLIGQMTNWTIDERYKMRFDERTNTYKLKTLLKQGYYEYQYVSVATDSANLGKVEYVLTEGDKADTENNYYIYFYVRNQFLDYHELVGFQRRNSRSEKKE